MTVNISNLKAPCPCGPNYHDVLQNTNEWKDLCKFKITGSRLPALLGLYGQEKFTKYWKVVKQGLEEEMLLKQTLRISSGVTNLRRKEYQYFAICPTVKLKPVVSLRIQVIQIMVLVQMQWLHLLSFWKSKQDQLKLRGHFHH